MKRNVPSPDQADAALLEVKQNEFPNPWWDALNSTGHYGQVHNPAVMWAGWYDIFLQVSQYSERTERTERTERAASKKFRANARRGARSCFYFNSSNRRHHRRFQTRDRSQTVILKQHPPRS